MVTFKQYSVCATVKLPPIELRANMLLLREETESVDTGNEKQPVPFQLPYQH
jgi:hypothetical protein